MPMYVVAVTERRTYQIEADTEAAAIERALGDPEDLPIGSLVSAVRSQPEIVRTEDAEADQTHGADQHAMAHRAEPEPADIVRTLLIQPWG